jgi:hypothetical protein
MHSFIQLKENGPKILTRGPLLAQAGRQYLSLEVQKASKKVCYLAVLTRYKVKSESSTFTDPPFNRDHSNEKCTQIS